MKRILTLRRSLLVVAALIVLAAAVGGTYVAAQQLFQRTITATWTILVSGDAIQVYEADGTTVVTSIDFGVSYIDFFGSVSTPTHPVVVKNLSASEVQVIVTGDGQDSIIPVFGPTTGSLAADPHNVFTLLSGDTTAGWLGLTMPQPTSGSKTTTIIFSARTTGGAPTGPLNIAVECDTGSQNCETSSESAFKIRDVLIQTGGHTAAVVDGSAIATTADLSNYDVVIVGGSGSSDNDYAEFQTALKQWVQSGGGVVVTGWALDNIVKQGLAGGDLAATLPVTPSTSLQFGGLITMTGDTSHPVTNGISSFTPPQFSDYGPIKQGATLLAVDGGNNPAVAVWEYGMGRAVYLSPGYFSSYSGYSTESLLDGSIPDALNLFLQAIEWAAGIGVASSASEASSTDGSSPTGFPPAGSASPEGPPTGR